MTALKDLLSLIADCLFALTHPQYWGQNHKYSKAWDKVLKDLMKSYDFKWDGDHTVTLGDILIWVSNHPYASFDLCQDGPKPFNIRPSRRTMHKAYQKLQVDTIKCQQISHTKSLKDK